jgi:hypothetical protein
MEDVLHQACTDCRYFSYDPETNPGYAAIAGRPDHGHCRRYPPSRPQEGSPGEKLRDQYPEVTPLDWCGEWAAAYPRTSVKLSEKDWRLIRAVAHSRHLQRQARMPSLAAVVAELVDAARDKLEADAEEFYKKYPPFRNEG